jgi:hypothetical protein
LDDDVNANGLDTPYSIFASIDKDPEENIHDAVLQLFSDSLSPIFCIALEIKNISDPTCRAGSSYEFSGKKIQFVCAVLTFRFEKAFSFVEEFHYIVAGQKLNNISVSIDDNILKDMTKTLQENLDQNGFNTDVFYEFMSSIQNNSYGQPKVETLLLFYDKV